MNKVGDEKCKERPLSPFKRRHFYLLGKNKKKIFFKKKVKVARIKCHEISHKIYCREKTNGRS